MLLVPPDQRLLLHLQLLLRVRLLELAGVLVEDLLRGRLRVEILRQHPAVLLPRDILLLKHSVRQLLLHEERLLRRDHAAMLSSAAVVYQLVTLHHGGRVSSLITTASLLVVRLLANIRQ